MTSACRCPYGPADGSLCLPRSLETKSRPKTASTTVAGRAYSGIVVRRWYMVVSKFSSTFR